jgi:signal transduction histidine kinase
VQQWADAVKRKSELINLTNTAFKELAISIQELKERDRQKVKIWSLATEEINKPLDDYSFVLRIVQENNGIPMIITDMAEQIVSSHNLGDLDERIQRKIEQNNPSQSPACKDSVFQSAKEDSLNSFITFWRTNREPIEIDLYEGEKQKIFYFDSIYYRTLKLEELQRNRDSLSSSFTEELVENDNLVPVMFIDKITREVIATNISVYDSTNSAEIILDLAAKNDSISIDLGNEREGVIYFEYSPEITQMKYFPFIQFFIIGLFVLIAYLVFSTFRRAEQDQVWVGMAKETAHQLGTPISSLMAWSQLLETQGVDKEIISEIDKDIERLSTVTNRFSKIGSEAMLTEENMVEILNQVIDYLRKRISKKIVLSFEPKQDVIVAMVNRSLIDWVFENIVKNAVDSMDSNGQIIFTIQQIEDSIQIEIKDTGKGIPANKLKTVFQPGYTTKKRGWGLGLSLVKRIVEDFHKGKVIVAHSELGVGTTFRITLKV